MTGFPIQNNEINGTRALCSRISGAVFLLLTGFGAVGSAQEPSEPGRPAADETFLFQEIQSVYSASKYEQKVTEAPAAVSIVTADEIKKFGYRTLADILRSVRGFYVTYDRNYSYLGVRGFNRPGDYNTRILLLVDGHRINDNIYDQAFIGTEFILDIDLIERLEIVRGPSSSLYGSNAFFGVINVITRRGRDLQGAEVSGEAGSYYTVKGRLSYGRRFDSGLEMLASGTVYDSNGPGNLFFPEYNTPATNYGVAHNVDDDQYTSFFAKGMLDAFTLEAARIVREKGIPTGAFGTVFNAPQNRTTDTRSYVDLKYDQTLPGRWTILGRLSYDRYSYEGDYLFYDPLIGLPPLYEYLNRDDSLGEWWGGEAQVSKKLGIHKLTAGAEYQASLHQDQSNVDVLPFYVNLDDRRRGTRWAFYFQDEMALLSRLNLTAGVRYDYYETFGREVTPRAGLVYGLSEKATVKVLYGEAFRSPNAYELYYQDGYTTKANLQLEPEKITSAEVIYEQYLGGHLRVTIDGFSNTIHDLITQQLDPADNLLVFRNVETVRANGVEMELENRWENGFEGRVSYTLQETKDRATGMLLTNSPRQLGKVNLIVPLVRNLLFTGVEGQYTGERQTLAGIPVGSVTIFNANLLAQNLARGLDISAAVYNVFDRRYADPGSEEHKPVNAIEQDGRTFRVKLVYRF